MTTQEYEAGVMRTMAPQEPILLRLVQLGPMAMQLDNAARGMADDVGEVNGCIKRHIEYGQPLDATNLLEELGDVLYRIVQAARAIGRSLEDVMIANNHKLAVRFPDKFSDCLAAEANRNREAERIALIGATPDACVTTLADQDAVIRVNRVDNHGFGYIELPDVVPDSFGDGLRKRHEEEPDWRAIAEIAAKDDPTFNNPEIKEARAKITQKCVQLGLFASRFNSWGEIVEQIEQTTPGHVASSTAEPRTNSSYSHKCVNWNTCHRYVHNSNISRVCADCAGRNREKYHPGSVPAPATTK